MDLELDTGAVKVPLINTRVNYRLAVDVRGQPFSANP